MHQRKGKKILIYFFLLLLVGSINNIGLSNLKFKEIDNINVVGLNDYENVILLQKIKDLNLGNIFLINKKEIINLINQNTLVEKYNVSKKYPSSLDINIQKTKFLARINNNGKVFLVGSNGKLSKNDFSNNELPFIFGKPDINEFLNFKKIIGDLYTSGYRIIGGVKCSQGGHYLTNQLLRKVFQNKENFSILEIKEKNLPHTLINKNLLRSIA